MGQLADFCAIVLEANQEIEEFDNGEKQVSMKSLLGSLWFLARRAEVPLLLKALGAKQIEGFRKNAALTSERKAAAPLPALVLVSLEKLLASASTPSGVKLVAGSMLICVLAGLRFSDAMRTRPASLFCNGWIIRGISWRTKAIVRGQPFGFIACGLTANFPDWGWGHHYIAALHSWLTASGPGGSKKGGLLIAGNKFLWQ